MNHRFNGGPIWYQTAVRRALLGLVFVLGLSACGASISRAQHEAELSKETAAAERRLRDVEAVRRGLEERLSRAEEAAAAEREALLTRVERLEAALAEKQGVIDGLYSEAQSEAALARLKTDAQKARAKAVTLLGDLQPEVEAREGGLGFSFPLDTLFDAGGTRLTAAGEARAAQLALRLSQLPASRLVLETHADQVSATLGGVEDSLRRTVLAALALADRLVTLGIDPARLSVRGAGRSERRSAEETAGGRAADRRLVIVVVDPGLRP